MKTFTYRLSVNKLLLSIFFISFYYNNSFAQLPTCVGTSAGIVYDQSGNGIYNLDPTQPLSSTNPSTNTITCNGTGLAVSDNLNASTPSPTFYTIENNNIYYYDGTNWINTGHSAGNPSAVNLGAGGGYLYNLVGFTGEVYVYTGTGNATLLTTIAGFNGGGPYDISGDCAGNFYILNTMPPQWLHEYSPTGALLQSWTLTGAPTASSGGGMAVIGNNVYYDNTGGYVSGVISGSTVNFTVVSASGLNPSPGDFASCPNGGVSSIGGIDTFFYCPGSSGLTLNATGQPPYSWTVVNGPATISGSGASVTVTTSANARIAYTSTSGCGTNADTIDIIVPTASVSAGGSKTVYGCGTYLDSLHGSLFNTQSWLTYDVSWSPSGSIVSGGNTLMPVIRPTANTTYMLSVSTPANEGGCLWTDTATVFISDASTHADFTYNIHYGCNEDTVTFADQSLAALYYRWRFDDHTSDTAVNPEHIYTTQGLYNVTLIVKNDRCTDSTTQAIDTRHPLQAQFTVDRDSICQGQSVTFTNTSVTTVQNGINPTYNWIFDDGSTSAQMNETHQYNYMGVYNVKMIVTDFVPCMDTAYETIVVDSQSTANIVTGDNVFCAGQQVTLNGVFSTEGITGYYWDFGNGDVIYNTNPVAHSYDEPGTHQVTLISNYRFCMPDTATTSYTIKAYPAINVGPDTTMCPNATPIFITDTVNTGNPNATWLWNTGDTTARIMVTQPGTYYATVTINGCSATDSVTVLKDCYVDVPNTFTPNNDGVNDYFFPRQFLSMGVTSFKMDIYNRWGEEVFATTNISGRGWDGKFNGADQPQDVYIYMIEITYKDGRSEQYKGNVTLLR